MKKETLTCIVVATLPLETEDENIVRDSILAQGDRCVFVSDEEDATAVLVKKFGPSQILEGISMKELKEREQVYDLRRRYSAVQIRFHVCKGATLPAGLSGDEFKRVQT